MVGCGVENVYDCVFSSPVDVDHGPRIGHPIQFHFTTSHDELELFVNSNSILRRTNAGKLFFTPLDTGIYDVELHVTDNGVPVIYGEQFNVAEQSYPWNLILRETTRPMMPLWDWKPDNDPDENIGLDLAEFKNHHVTGMHRIQYGPLRFGQNSVNEPLPNWFMNDIAQNETLELDQAVFLFKFPWPQQFHDTDYSAIDDNGRIAFPPVSYTDVNGDMLSQREGLMALESPFATEGPQDVAGWTTLILQQVKNAGHSVDHLIMDWEGAVGRTYEVQEQCCINGNNCLGNWENQKKYDIYGVYSPRDPAICNVIEDATRLDPRFQAAGGDPNNAGIWNPVGDTKEVVNLKKLLWNEKERILETAFKDPTKAEFPNALFTQYNHIIFSDSEGFLNKSNRTELSKVRPDSADAQSPSVYFDQTGNSSWSEAEVIMRALEEVRTVHRTRPDHYLTAPWIASPYSPQHQRANGSPAVPDLSFESQWEAVMHFLLSGIDEIIFWNAEHSAASHVVQNAWTTFINVVPDNTKVVEWWNEDVSDNILLSAVKDEEGLVYAFVTFLNGAQSVDYLGFTLQRPNHPDMVDVDPLDIANDKEKPYFGFYILAPPTGDAKINNDDRVTASHLVNLNITGDQTVDQMRLANTREALELKLYDPFASEVFGWDLNQDLQTTEDGPRMVFVQLKSSTLGKESPVLTDKIILDETQPAISITAPEANAEVFDYVSVVAPAAPETTHVTFLIDGNEFETDHYTYRDENGADPYLVALNTLTYPDGRHVLAAKAYDLAGNEAVSEGVPIEINNGLQSDIQGSVEINLGKLATNNLDVALKTNASSINGQIMQMRFSNDGINFPDGYIDYDLTATWTLTSGLDGERTVYAQFKDETGVESALFSDTIFYDTTPPESFITTPLPDSVLTGDVLIEASVTDNSGFMGLVTFNLENDPIAGFEEPPYSTVWSSQEAANGPHILKVKAVDDAGNFAESPPIPVTIDNLRVHIDSPADGSLINNPNPILQFTVEGQADTQEIYLNNQLINIQNGQALPLAGDGPYELRIFVSNATQNHEDISHFTLDTVPPEVAITSPENNSIITDPHPELLYNSLGGTVTDVMLEHNNEIHHVSTRNTERLDLFGNGSYTLTVVVSDGINVVQDVSQFTFDGSNLAQCEDGLDNDNDGLIDYPLDPGCASVQDNDEQNGQNPNNFTFDFVDSNEAAGDPKLEEGLLRNIAWNGIDISKDVAIGGAHNCYSRYYAHSHDHTCNSGGSEGWSYQLSDGTRVEERHADITYQLVSESAGSGHVRASTNAIKIEDLYNFVGDHIYVTVKIKNQLNEPITTSMPFNLGELQLVDNVFNDQTGEILVANTYLLDQRRGGYVRPLQYQTVTPRYYPAIQAFSPLHALWDSTRTILVQYLTPLYLPERVGFLEIRNRGPVYDQGGNQIIDNLELLQSVIEVPLAPGEEKTFTVAIGVGGGGGEFNQNWKPAAQPYKDWFYQTYGTETTYHPPGSFGQYVAHNSVLYHDVNWCLANNIPLDADRDGLYDRDCETFAEGTTLKQIYDDVDINTLRNLQSNLAFNASRTTVHSRHVSRVPIQINPMSKFLDYNLDAGPYPEKIAETVQNFSDAGSNFFMTARPCVNIDGAGLEYEYDQNGQWTGNVTFIEGTPVPDNDDMDLRDPETRDKALAWIEDLVGLYGVKGFYFDAMGCPGDEAWLEYVRQKFIDDYQVDIFSDPNTSYVEGAVDRKALHFAQIPILRSVACVDDPDRKDFYPTHSSLIDWLVPNGTYASGSFNKNLCADEKTEIAKDHGYQLVVDGNLKELKEDFWEWLALGYRNQVDHPCGDCQTQSPEILKPMFVPVTPELNIDTTNHQALLGVIDPAYDLRVINREYTMLYLDLVWQGAVETPDETHEAVLNEGFRYIDGYRAVGANLPPVDPAKRADIWLHVKAHDNNPIQQKVPWWPEALPNVYQAWHDSVNNQYVTKGYNGIAALMPDIEGDDYMPNHRDDDKFALCDPQSYQGDPPPAYTSWDDFIQKSIPEPELTWCQTQDPRYIESYKEAMAAWYYHFYHDILRIENGYTGFLGGYRDSVVSKVTINYQRAGTQDWNYWTTNPEVLNPIWTGYGNSPGISDLMDLNTPAMYLDLSATEIEKQLPYLLFNFELQRHWLDTDPSWKHKPIWPYLHLNSQSDDAPYPNWLAESAAIFLGMEGADGMILWDRNDISMERSQYNYFRRGVSRLKAFESFLGLGSVLLYDKTGHALYNESDNNRRTIERIREKNGKMLVAVANHSKADGEQWQQVFNAGSHTSGIYVNGKQTALGVFEHDCPSGQVPNPTRNIGCMDRPIVEGNDPPTAANDTAETDEDTPININVLANDTDPENDPLDVTQITQLPAHGQAVIEQDNTVTYTPNQDYNGDDQFEYEVTDGNGGFDRAAVSVTIHPVNDPPDANAGQDSEALEGILVTLDGTASYDIEDGQNLIFAWEQVITGEEPRVQLVNVYTATPEFEAPEVGPEGVVLTFRLTVRDQNLVEDSDEVLVTVMDGTENGGGNNGNGNNGFNGDGGNGDSGSGNSGTGEGSGSGSTGTENNNSSNTIYTGDSGGFLVVYTNDQNSQGQTTDAALSFKAGVAEPVIGTSDHGPSASFFADSVQLEGAYDNIDPFGIDAAHSGSPEETSWKITPYPNTSTRLRPLLTQAPETLPLPVSTVRPIEPALMTPSPALKTLVQVSPTHPSFWQSVIRYGFIGIAKLIFTSS